MSRWSVDLDIFQDCLDLRPEEAFKPQLAAQITRCDRFLLFWSRHAAASPWVRWELDTALQSKGVRGVVAMPLEDLAIAPPPPELADLQMRDRYMLASYALQQIGNRIHVLKVGGGAVRSPLDTLPASGAL